MNGDKNAKNQEMAEKEIGLVEYVCKLGGRSNTKPFCLIHSIKL